MKIKTYVKLNIREHPTMDSKILGILPKDSECKVIEARDDFYNIEQGGWIVKKYTKVIRKRQPRSFIAINIEGAKARPMRAADDVIGNAKADIADEYDKIMGKTTKPLDEYSARSTIKDMNGIFALPPNFTESCDYRPNGFKYGSYYIRNILSDGALISIVPGEPRFLPSVSDENKSSIVKIMNNLDSEEAQLKYEEVKKLIQDNVYGRYYIFEPKVSEYFKYVNDICQLCAKFLGIANKGADVLGATYGRYDWRNFKSNNRDVLFGGEAQDRFIAFYVDPSADANESLSNNTRESILAGLSKKASETVKEGQFLMGTAGAPLDSPTNDMKSFTETVGGGAGGILDKLGSSTKVITNGGNLVFPEIWGDSDFDKSYSIPIKLQSPSGHIEDLFMHIVVPYVHLLCLTAPRQIMANGYVSPFLIRLFAKGWLNCDMGIVSSLSVKKGGGGDAWSMYGLPTEMEITLSVKDLYSSLSIANTDNTGMMLSNTGLIDHIGTLCGLNVHKPDLARRLLTAAAMFKNKYYNKIPNTIASIDEFVGNMLDRNDSLIGW